MEGKYKRNDLVFDLMSVFSFMIGLENLGKNNEQIEALEKHLKKQDEQYEEIIELLKETRTLKGGKHGRKN